MILARTSSTLTPVPPFPSPALPAATAPTVLYLPSPLERCLSPKMLARMHPLMREYIDYLILRARERTAQSVLEALDGFLAWVRAQHLDVLCLTKEILFRYQEYLLVEYRTRAGKPLARKTAVTRIVLIKGFYAWLVDCGHLVVDPARHLGISEVRSRVVVSQPLTLQEVTAILQTASARVRQHRPGTSLHVRHLRNLAALSLSLATGRRIGGLVGLKLSQVDVPKRELRIEREKGHAGRVLPVKAWAMDIVARYLATARPRLAHGHDTPWLFLNPEGTGHATRGMFSIILKLLLPQVRRQNPDLVDLQRKRVTWHSLRTSFATLMFRNGCDIRVVNELMLHRDLSTTARYTPVPVEDLRQVFRSAHPRP
jgi:integrase/recombinase XerD